MICLWYITAWASVVAESTTEMIGFFLASEGMYHPNADPIFLCLCTSDFGSMKNLQLRRQQSVTRLKNAYKNASCTTECDEVEECVLYKDAFCTRRIQPRYTLLCKTHSTLSHFVVQDAFNLVTLCCARRI